MTCPKCGALIPDKFIGCPTCLERNSRREVLPRILAGKEKLKTVRYAGRTPHLASLTNAETTWCGWTVSRFAHRQAVELTHLDGICRDCRQAFEDLKNAEPSRAV
jgi:predicted amidophosphoribosyltransferase